MYSAFKALKIDVMGILILPLDPRSKRSYLYTSIAKVLVHLLKSVLLISTVTETIKTHRHSNFK